MAKERSGFCMKAGGLVRLVGIVCLALSWSWTAHAETVCRSDATFSLSLDGSSLSLDSKHACLGTILEELARQADVEIQLPRSAADKPVTALFRKLSLEEGLERILEGMDYILETRAQTDPMLADAAPPTGSVAIWFLSRELEPTTIGLVGSNAPKGPFEQEAPAPPEDDEAEDLRALAEQAGGSPDPELRAAAVQLIVQADDKVKAVEMILTGLRDPAAEVRGSALGVVGDLGPNAALAVDLIGEIALHDERPELRMRALQKLVEGQYPQEITVDIMTAALQDRDKQVSDLARALLDLGTR